MAHGLPALPPESMDSDPDPHSKFSLYRKLSDSYLHIWGSTSAAYSVPIGISLLPWPPKKCKVSVACQGWPAECSNHLSRTTCTVLFLPLVRTKRTPVETHFKLICTHMPVTSTRNSLMKHFQNAAMAKKCSAFFVPNCVKQSKKEKRSSADYAEPEKTDNDCTFIY